MYSDMFQKLIWGFYCEKKRNILIEGLNTDFKALCSHNFCCLFFIKSGSEVC